MSDLTTAPSPSSALPAAIRSGAFAAVATWAVVILPALVGWLAAPESSLSWFSAVQVGSAIWFLGHGQSIGSTQLTISLTPVMLLLTFVYITFRWGRTLAGRERAAMSTRGEWSRIAKLALVPGFLAGYLMTAVVVSLLTLGGPVAPGPSAVLGALLVPVIALGCVLVRPDDEDSPDFVRAWFRRGPTWLPSAWGVGWRGARLLLVIGLAVVGLRLLISFGDIARVQDEFGLGLVAALVVLLAQVFVLGNGAVWALGFLAGPGFQVAVGSVISPTAAHPGLMPLVPVLAALPNEADYPPLVFAVVLVPVAAGMVIGRWVDAELEFFGNWRARAVASATAAAIGALAVSVLAWLSNGAIGVERLAAVGVPVASFTGALLLEVVAGAVAWAGWRTFRERAAGPHEARGGDHPQGEVRRLGPADTPGDQAGAG